MSKRVAAKQPYQLDKNHGVAQRKAKSLTERLALRLSGWVAL